jgi:hypothetical protein
MGYNTLVCQKRASKKSKAARSEMPAAMGYNRNMPLSSFGPTHYIGLRICNVTRRQKTSAALRCSTPGKTAARKNDVDCNPKNQVAGESVSPS